MADQDGETYKKPKKLKNAWPDSEVVGVKSVEVKVKEEPQVKKHAPDPVPKVSVEIKSKKSHPKFDKYKKGY